MSSEIQIQTQISSHSPGSVSPDVGRRLVHPAHLRGQHGHPPLHGLLPGGQVLRPLWVLYSQHGISWVHSVIWKFVSWLHPVKIVAWSCCAAFSNLYAHGPYMYYILSWLLGTSTALFVPYCCVHVARVAQSWYCCVAIQSQFSGFSSGGWEMWFPSKQSLKSVLS